MRKAYHNGLQQLFDPDLFTVVRNLQHVWMLPGAEWHEAEWLALVTTLGTVPKGNDDKYEALKKLLGHMQPSAVVGQFLSNETSFQRKGSVETVEWAVVLMSLDCWSIALQVVRVAQTSPSSFFDLLPDVQKSVSDAKIFGETLNNIRGYATLNSFLLMCENNLEGSPFVEFRRPDHLQHERQIERGEAE